MEATSSSRQEFPDDCLPPESSYESRAALITAINKWAYTRGYAFVTKRSTKEKSGKLTVVYACDRSCRDYASERPRQRKTTTRSNNCPFSVLAKESRDGNVWIYNIDPIDNLPNITTNQAYTHQPTMYTAHSIPKPTLGYQALRAPASRLRKFERIYAKTRVQLQRSKTSTTESRTADARCAKGRVQLMP